MPSQGQPINSNFTAGELSPLVKGRFDLEIYQNGLETCENWTILPYGGFERRNGSEFVKEVADNSEVSRLIKFVFSRTEAYVLEFSDLLIRVFRFDANGDPEHVAAVSLVTPYLEAELFDLSFTQDQDIIYITHDNHAPRRVTKLAFNSWTIASFDDANEILNPEPEQTPVATSEKKNATKAPYFDFPGDLFPGVSGRFAISISINVTVAAFDSATEQVVTAIAAFTFSASDIGAIFKESATTTAGHKGYWIITSFISSSQVNAKMLTDSTAYSTSISTRIARWGAWHDARTSFPNAVTKFESRLLFANVLTRRQTIWGSKPGDFENFDNGVPFSDPGDGSSYEFELDAPDVSPIRWLIPMRVLLIGTEGAEYRMTGFDAPVTPTSVDIKQQTAYGSKDSSILRIGQSVMFIQRDGRKVRRYDFTDTFDNYIAQDMTFLSEHITIGGIKTLDYSQEPNNTVWAIRSDGELIAMTLYPELNVVAWHRYKFPNGVVESVAVIPSFDGIKDRVWITVKRTIDGGTKRYIEVLDDALNTDAAKKFTAVGGSALTGLSHLEGEVVDVVADGIFLGVFTVSGNQIADVGRTVTDAEVGIHYDAEAKLMPFPTRPLSKKRSAEIQLRVDKIQAGITMNGEVITTFKGEDPMDSPPPVFTGLTKTHNLGWDDENQVVIKSTLPFDGTILALAGRLEIGD